MIWGQPSDLTLNRERGPRISLCLVASLRFLILQPRLPVTGVSCALPTRNHKRVSRESRGLPAPASKKCSKQLRPQNSLRSLKKDRFETPETVLTLFRTLFGPWNWKAPGHSLETLSGFRARWARETPVRGGQGRLPNRRTSNSKCDEFENNGSASSKPTTEFAQPRLSRVKARSSPARGYKFGYVCSYMAGHEDAGVVTGHIGTNTHTHKFVPPRWGRLRFDSNGAVQIRLWVWSSLKW